MSENPFASFNVEIPKKYSEDIKKYCVTGGNRTSKEIALFKRQIDFWYFSFIYSIKHGLGRVSENNTSNITPASILSTDPYRITNIQLAFLAQENDLVKLSNHKLVFDFALESANSAMPHVLQILNDPDDKPLWSLLDNIESE